MRGCWKRTLTRKCLFLKWYKSSAGAHHDAQSDRTGTIRDAKRSANQAEHAGLQVKPFEVPVTTSKFDMAVFMPERPDGLIGYRVYSTELFEPGTTQQMLPHFTTLLQSIVRQPDSRLSTLAILSPEEIEQLEAEKLRRKRRSRKS